MKQTIYLDNAATTRVRPEVVEAMIPYFTELYGNPSSVYEFASPAKQAITAARETIAGALGAKPQEIYFTGGGSESDNWALRRTRRRESTSSPRRSSTTRSCTPANTWKSTDLRSPIWTWMSSAR